MSPQETISTLQQFLTACLTAVQKAKGGTMSREEAALEISGTGICLHLWDPCADPTSGGYQKIALVIGKEGCHAIKELIDLAADLEVPKKHYSGDYQKDWDALVMRVKRLEEMLAVKHNQKDRDHREEQRHFAI